MGNKQLPRRAASAQRDVTVTDSLFCLILEENGRYDHASDSAPGDKRHRDAAFFMAKRYRVFQ
jgi:hypothetical protein